MKDTTNINYILAVDAIKDLQAKYCRFVDQKNWDQLKGLFSQQPTLTFYAVDGSILYEFHSSDQFIEACKTIEEAVSIHQIHHAEIQLIGETEAKAIVAMEDRIYFDADKESPFKKFHGFGFYYNHYEYVDGQWKIREVKLKRLKLDIT